MNNLTSHTIVKNGEQFIEPVLKSILGRVKYMKIVDTGSTDGTVDIINDFINHYNAAKISFERVGPFKGDWQQGIPELTKLRNRMLAETKTEWVVIIDDDEIWPDRVWNGLYELFKNIPKDAIAITVPFLDIVDVSHIVASPIQSPANRIVKAKKFEYRGDWPNEAWFVKGENQWLNKFRDKRVLHLKNNYFHLGRLKKRTDITRPEDKINTVPFIGEMQEFLNGQSKNRRNYD